MKHSILKPIAALVALSLAGQAAALPAGGAFNIGNGTINTSGSQTSVNVTSVPAGYTMPGWAAPAMITWSGGYNIAPGETVNYTTPLSQNVQVVNYDPSGSMSRIGGTVNAPNNMAVLVVNPNGVQVSSTANITAKAFAAAVGTITVKNAQYGNMQLTLMPGDLDISPTASITATDANCSSCLGIGTSPGWAIDVNAAATGQNISLPVTQGFGSVDLHLAGAQNYSVPNQVQPAGYSSSIRVGDGSTLSLNNVNTASTPLSIQGTLSSISLNNSTQSVTYSGKVLASKPGDTSNVTLNNYGGTFKAYYGVDNLTLQGDNSAATVYASVFNDTKVDGSVRVGDTYLATRGFGGTADGWHLDVAAGKTLEVHGGPVPVAGKYDTQASTGYFGKLTDGSLHTGSVSGTVNVTTSPVDSNMTTPYIYTFGPEVTFSGSLGVNTSLLDYSGVNVRTGTFYDATGVPSIVFKTNSPGAAVNVMTWDAGGGYASGTFNNAVTGTLGSGTIQIADSTLGSVSATSGGNIDIARSQLGGTLASAGGDFTATNSTFVGAQVTLGGVNSTVLTGSTVNATTATLGLAPYYQFNPARNYGVAQFLGLNGTVVDKLATGTSNKIVLEGTRVVTDAATVLKSTAAQGAAFAGGVGFDIAQPAWYGGGTATLGTVYVADDATVNVNTSTPLGAQNPVLKYNQVAITDTAGRLGTPVNYDTAGMPAPALRSNVGITFRSNDVLLRGAVFVNGPNGATTVPAVTTPDTSLTFGNISQTPATVVFNPTSQVTTTVLPPVPVAPSAWQVDSSNLPASYVIDVTKLEAPLLPDITLSPYLWSFNNQVVLPTAISGDFVKNLPSFTTLNLDPNRFSFVDTQRLATVHLPTAPAVQAPQLPAATPTLPAITVDPTRWVFADNLDLKPVTLPVSLPALPQLQLPAPVVIPTVANPLLTGINVEFSDGVSTPTMRGTTLFINPGLVGTSAGIVPAVQQ